MNATITIVEIAASCVIGVTEAERAKKQTILISLELVVDIQEAVETDTITHSSVDYKKIYETTIAIVEKSKFRLLESLAKELLDTYVATIGVKKVAVTVTKSSRLPKAKGVSITLRGEKHE